MHLKYTEENKMPSKSKKQHNLMEAVAHNKAFAKKVGIPIFYQLDDLSDWLESGPDV